jgi:arylsulfatase A-like enzyme
LKIISCLSTILLLCGATISTIAQQRPPNIIFILADDLGYGDVGFQGQTKIQTPNIDHMARQGLSFTQFYAGTTVCAPSRASLLTGLHTGHTAVRGNRGFKPERQFPLPDSSLTIATVLQQRGYTTGIFGKWGLGYPGSSGTPLKKGFTDFFGYNCQSLAHNYYPDHLWSNDEKVNLPGNHPGNSGSATSTSAAATGLADSTYSADLIHRHALQFLRQQKTKPFFLFLAYTLPHAQLEGPHDSIYQHYLAQFPETGAHPHASYAAMVTRLDHYVGEIIQQVREQGLSDNTLIFFTSDNGPHREGGGDPDFFNSSGGLRGIKRDLYEGGIRVPFIAVWKGKIKAGSSTSYPAAFWDLFPTFEVLTGQPVTKGIDGLSVVRVLLGKGKPARQHDYLYWEFHEGGGSQAVRWGKWKGVRLNVNTVADPPLELYDLEQDPKEISNIAAQHPDIVKQIETDMRSSHQYNKDWPLLKEEIH